MKKLTIIMILFLCVLVCISSAVAVPWIYKASGTVTTHDGYDPLGWGGSPFSVKMSFDSDQPFYTSDPYYDGFGTTYRPQKAYFHVNGVDKTYLYENPDIGSDFALRFYKTHDNTSDRVRLDFGLEWYGNMYGELIPFVGFQIEYPFDTLGQYGTPIPISQTLDISDSIGTYGLGCFADWDIIDKHYHFDIQNFEAGQVPEPTAMLLFGAGLVGLAGFGRKKFKK